MRKLHELTGDEFFDVIGVLSPILPVLSDLEIVQAQIGSYNETIAEARQAIAFESAKKKPDTKEILRAKRVIDAETASVFTRDIAKLVPLIAIQHRDVAYGLLAIIDQVPVSEVKRYPGAKIMTQLIAVFRDTDFGSFLSYAEPLKPIA